MEYTEDDFLMISGIQHFRFCQRQWALIHIEQAWQDNLLTFDGQILHTKADQPEIREKRNDKLIVRSLPVHSRELGLTGICDVVEFTEATDGVSIFGSHKKYLPQPIEYKHGHKKYDLSDTLQLLAQAVCLEEMLGCQITSGGVFYQKTRRREVIEFTANLREQLKKTTRLMHQYWTKRYTPRVKTGAWCKSCSLADICLPELLSKQTVQSYLRRRLDE
ncbi:CRISPR-associated protein Cas4 [Loigolactobacillus coryniformis]|uniref:CRISPR-associated exonuclease Cas4 n=1 Tax=Loigolactobacillus coryniformis subsp. coryniformis CECT 5711 TaxID=1185325 RepID=J3ERG2_9LACO|nr:CRISPR-associated protein Cas4 [Loigolactobacillus coryniformis]EJN56200.1 Exonuclease RecB family [Loigolactobacillus coryniformis subsp. coryniformis CECT 5711]MDN5952995.1 CRISPR-associated protein Cas4 [Loigolactobacillus coryniformis]MDT3391901.1 CRISPR-associated protein Cas4 [Bacillota bacterium]